MFVRLAAEGTAFELLDPDASLLRDALPRGGYEPAVSALLANALAATPQPVFFDIGALYGYFSAWAALRGARVVAFEPGERYADVLELNLRRNACRGVRVERMALGDTDGTRAFAARTLVHAGERRRGYARGWLNQFVARPPSGTAVALGAEGWRAPLGAWLAANLAERLGLFASGADLLDREVRVHRLDGYVAKAGVAPNVIKLDVHGGEAGVLRGMPQTLRDHVEALIVEVHTTNLLVDGSHEEIVTLLEAAGLDVFELRGFRRRQATLVPLAGTARRDFCDQRRWTAEDLYFMRCLYACRPR